MPYWIYDPKRLTSSSTLIPYKHQDFGDFLNLLTLSLFVAYIYIYKNKQVDKHGKNVLSVLLTILIFGMLTGLRSQNETNENYHFDQYDNSLYIK